MTARRSKPVQVKVTRMVAAPASRVYSVLADYRTGHPRILPRAFQDLTVEEGGRGEGTVIRFGMKSFGTVRRVRATVHEPEPGRILVERVLDDPPVETTFTVEAGGPDRSLVSIQTSWTPTGVRALVERILGPFLLRRVFAEELGNLERVAAEEEETG